MTPTLSKILTGTLVTLAFVFTGPVHAQAQKLVADHMKCFQIRDDLSQVNNLPRRTIYTADLSPETGPFGNQNCKIKLPASHFCVTTAKSNVQNPNGTDFNTLGITGTSAGDFLCYHLQCDKEAVVVEATDQFGNRTVKTKKADYFCLPAERIVSMHD